MAYFSNSSEGSVFDDQCQKCRYGEKPCPIALVQALYNYDAVNNKVATEILNNLVENNGTCTMFKTFQFDFQLTEDEKNQLEFFSEHK
jgi:hypothetical protein